MSVPFGITLTLLEKAGNEPITKSISPDPKTGKPISDSRCCWMTHGSAIRYAFDHFDELAATISECGSHQALALGRLRDDLPDQVEIVTKDKLNGANGADGIIARSQEFLQFHVGAAAVALFDFDQKGMPASVKEKLAEAGGLWPVLVSVVPALDRAARITRASTSAGLSSTKTGEKFPDSGGLHIYVAVKDGTDIERFLEVLAACLWLAGYGWLIVDVAGRLLVRSPIDVAVSRPERPVFEGPPILAPPLVQDAEARRPIVVDGGLLDTRVACPPLTPVEIDRIALIRAEEEARLRPEAAAARHAYIAARADDLAQRTGMSNEAAAKIIASQCGGILLPDIVLPFDDPEFDGCTVGDVLAHPARFAGATLADPLEGHARGRDKAKLFCNDDGSLIIHSFVHGGGNFRLCYDEAAAKAAIDRASAEEAAQVYVACVLNSELAADAVERLRNHAEKVHKVSRRVLNNMLAAARDKADKAKAEAMRERRLKTGAAGRPLLPVPRSDAELRPVVAQISDTFATLRQRMPPLRDIERHNILVTLRDLPSLHLLTSVEVNVEDDNAQTETETKAKPKMQRGDQR
jgi:hypothetical protein